MPLISTVPSPRGERRRAVVDPARHAVGADQAVLDVAFTARAQGPVERIVGRAVLGVDGGVPVDHAGVGLGAAEQAVGAGALEDLLQRARRHGRGAR